eukprot:TRINITY_DN3447_c0_g1_i2.p1 TRINITY_DN3447_c0_g1~~TRINITY_DN3447_c0_g1_i2.p1  ORF type:complete len:163 (+),score=45.43 TRINITY_DN3447_c0_g1_i2:147-635(+)
MAAITACVPTFVGLKASAIVPAKLSTTAPVSVKAVCLAPRASLEKTVKTALIASTASALLAGSALAVEILAGGPNGELYFKPDSVSVSSGEEIKFVVKGAPPHNVVFTDAPDGVDVDAISIESLKFLGAIDKTWSVTLTTPGEYSYECQPHSSVMNGTIIVS